MQRKLIPLDEKNLKIGGGGGGGGGLLTTTSIKMLILDLRQPLLLYMTKERLVLPLANKISAREGLRIRVLHKWGPLCILKNLWV